MYGVCRLDLSHRWSRLISEGGPKPTRARTLYRKVGYFDVMYTAFVNNRSRMMDRRLLPLIPFRAVPPKYYVIVFHIPPNRHVERNSTNKQEDCKLVHSTT